MGTVTSRKVYAMRATTLFFLMLAFSLAFSAANPSRLESAPAQSERDVEAVLDLLGHLEIDSIGDNLFAMMAERTVPTMRSHIPNLPEEAYALLHEELSTAFKSGTADLMTSHARLYLEHLSPEDIAEMNAFYSTPTGKKMLRVLPMLMQQSLYIGQEWVQKLDRDVRRNWTERLKREGYIKE